MAVLILPVASIVMLFSYDILLLWTGNVEAARNAAPIASILVIGTALNGLMNLPYALQLAYGWTTLGLRINAVFIITLVPATIVLATRYGAVGAATVWVALNALYMIIAVPLTHRRLLKGEGQRWFIRDVSLPLVGAVLIVWLGRALVVGPMSRPFAAISMSAVLIAALALTALTADHVRLWLLSQLSWSLRVHRVQRP
jgi:O-antigen/teichoic acid export membrane protein